MERRNALLEKTLELALEAVVLYKILTKQSEFVLSKQFLRSSTAPGAMAREAQSAHSRRDFISKLEIGLKELRECEYWIEVLASSNYLTGEICLKFNSTHRECMKLFTSIIVTAKSKN